MYVLFLIIFVFQWRFTPVEYFFEKIESSLNKNLIIKSRLLDMVTFIILKEAKN